jgi:sugar lactone lactonase YvrE
VDGRVRPPRKGEFFWSEIKGTVIRAIEDETGVNRLGEPTGGRKILRPVAPSEKPKRPRLRLVKDDEG